MEMITATGKVMTPRQIDFVTHFMETMDARQSCLSAGYSKSYCKTRTKVLLLTCKPAIDGLRRRAEERSAQKADLFMTTVVDLINYGAEKDEEGKVRDGHLAAKALELLGKSEGRFSETVRHQGQPVSFNLDLGTTLPASDQKPKLINSIEAESVTLPKRSSDNEAPKRPKRIADQPVLLSADEEFLKH